MKTIEIKVYSFNELSEDAQQTAIQNYLNEGYEPAWDRENLESFLKFCKIFNLKLKNYSLSSYMCDADICSENSEEINNLNGIRLLKYIWNNFKNDIYKGKFYNVKVNKPVNHKRVISKTYKNGNTFNGYYSAIQLNYCCPLTGYCMDDSILKPIFDFMQKPCKYTTFLDLMEECKENWLSAVKSDYEYQESKEYISDFFEANEYQFLENGTQF